MKALIALTSIVGFLMVVLPGPLYQYAGVSLGTAFTSLRFGVYVGGAALILIILQVLINRKNVSWGSTFICAILALVAVGMPVSMMSKASAVPPIHDITTDVTNPPEFVAIAPLREGAPNSIAYEGGEVTKQQLEAYPEIKTQLLPQPANEVFIADPILSCRSIVKRGFWRRHVRVANVKRCLLGPVTSWIKLSVFFPVTQKNGSSVAHRHKLGMFREVALLFKT